MPTYRSITVSLTSQFDLINIPEFAPPQVPNDPFLPLPALVDPVQGLISVYIPIYPLSQFWITYSISPPYPPEALFYFKLFHNGSCLVSWGCGEEDEYKGKTMFGLYDYGEKWKGQPLIERRILCFGNDKKGAKKVLENYLGDLVEIRVYRARGRKQIQPFTESYQTRTRPKNKKSLQKAKEGGIDLIHAGVLEEVHPQTFYKYALIDPIDKPFATFRYYYRSWSKPCVPPQRSYQPILDELKALGVTKRSPSPTSSICSPGRSEDSVSASHSSTPFAIRPSSDDSLAHLQPIISRTSASPPPAGIFPTHTPSSPLTLDLSPSNPSPTIVVTPPRTTMSPLGQSNIPHSRSSPPASSFTSPTGHSAFSSRLESQSPSSRSRNGSLGILKGVVDSASKRRARCAGKADALAEAPATTQQEATEAKTDYCSMNPREEDENGDDAEELRRGRDMQRKGGKTQDQLVSEKAL